VRGAKKKSAGNLLAGASDAKRARHDRAAHLER
jgi:hypothetical protein